MPRRGARQSMPVLALVLAIVAAGACQASPAVPSTPPSEAVASPTGLASAPVPQTATPTEAPAFPEAAPTFVLLGPPPAGELDDAVGRDLQAVLDDIVAGGSPNAIAAVITPQGRWAGAAGVSGPDGRAATAEDVASLASVSKLFVAAAGLRLAEEGRIDPDAPLDALVAGKGADANGATLRQALAMRSGIGNTVGAVDVCDRDWTDKEVVGTFPVPHASPGTAFDYSNPTYKIVGYALESASGQPLATLIDDVVRRGGGGVLLLQGTGEPTPSPWALPVAGHGGALPIERFGDGAALPCLGDARLSLGAAGMAGDMPSLAAWGYALFGGSVVDADSLAAMLPTADAYGLGMEQLGPLGVPGSIAVGHTGSKDGYKVVLAYQPAKQAVVAMIINDGTADDPVAPVILGARRLIERLPGP